MRSPEAQKQIDKILSIVEKEGIKAEKLIPLIQNLREFALSEEDPLVTRTLRLTWQHLESNEGFEISYLEDAETQEENFVYMFELIKNSDNKYNRDELREITQMLQALV